MDPGPLALSTTFSLQQDKAGLSLSLSIHPSDPGRLVTLVPSLVIFLFTHCPFSKCVSSSPAILCYLDNEAKMDGYTDSGRKKGSVREQGEGGRTEKGHWSHPSRI